MTRKQKAEIDFLIAFKDIQPTLQECEEYLSHTVNGAGELPDISNMTNPLFHAKRSFDISLKMWREGIDEGILNPNFEFDNEKWGRLPYFQEKIKPKLVERFKVEGLPKFSEMVAYVL